MFKLFFCYVAWILLSHPCIIPYFLDFKQPLRIIPAKMYAVEDIYPKYACPACEGSGDEENPVFRQAAAVKYFIPKSITTNELLAYVMTNKFCEHMPFYRREKSF